MWLAPDIWMVLQVVPRSESKVSLILRNKSYEHFLPMRKVQCRGSRNTRDVPLFGGYIFCRPNSNALGRIVTTPGVSRIVSFGGAPAVVADEEILAIKRIVASGNAYKPTSYLRLGQRVRILGGPLQGITGLLKRVKNKRKLVVSVELLTRSVEVEIEDSDIEELDSQSMQDTSPRQQPICHGSFRHEESFKPTKSLDVTSGED